MELGSNAAGSGEYEVRIEAVPAGGDQITVSLFTPVDSVQHQTVKLPFGPAEVAAAVDTARGLTEKTIARRQQELPADPLRALGRQLFDAVFEGKRRVWFDRCRETAREAGTGLRVRIVPRSGNSGDTRWLPWEFLYDDRRADFLALSTLTPVVRDVGHPHPPHDWITLVAPPVRVLVVTADVTGTMGVAEEVEQIREIAARNRGRLRLTVLSCQTAGELLAAVRKRDYHVLHFSGTGVPPGATGPGPAPRGQSGLIMMPEDRKPNKAGGYASEQVVWAEDLLAAVANRPAVRLVLLDACHTDDVAARLAGAVQGVVGVRGLISVKACVAFTLEFYRAVARGEPLDAALTSARQQIDHRLTGSREWGVQILYLQTPDGEFAQWPQLEGLATGLVGAADDSDRNVAPDRRKAALERALLQRNQQVLNDLMDRADNDVPDPVREQLRTIRARMKKL